MQNNLQLKKGVWNKSYDYKVNHYKTLKLIITFNLH